MAAEEIKRHLHDLQGDVVNFAFQTIKNAKLRKEYIDLAKETSENILKEAEAAVLSDPSNASKVWQDAAAKASELRNVYLNLTRQNVSKGAKAFSEMLKEEGLTYATVVEKYSSTVGGSTSFESLSALKQQAVLAKVIEASGRTSPNVNTMAKFVGKAGVALILLTMGIVIYTICEAQNPTLEAVKQAVSLGFGVAGSIAGTELGAAIGACGGPVGVIIGALVGGIVGGFLAGFGGDKSVDVLYRAFLPASFPGPGPPLFDVYPVLYGQPDLGSVPCVGPPKLDVIPGQNGQPDLGLVPIVNGPPDLFPH